MRRGKQLLFSMLDCPKPIIAKINGHAIGLGATLALFCDLTYATLTAKIGDPHVCVGFVAGDGGAAIWLQLIGDAKAKEYLLTGEPLTGEPAACIGLINHAVVTEELTKPFRRWRSSWPKVPRKPSSGPYLRSTSASIRRQLGDRCVVRV